MQLMGPRVAALGTLMASTAVALMASTAVVALSAVASPAATAGAGTGVSAPDDGALARIGRLMFFDPSLSASGKLGHAGAAAGRGVVAGNRTRRIGFEGAPSAAQLAQSTGNDTQTTRNDIRLRFAR
jgi:cytochrome c peroxidase